MDRSVMELIIENKRILHWLLIGGGVIVILVGMCTDKLSEYAILLIFSNMLTAVFGIKWVNAVNQLNGGSPGEEDED